MANSRVFVSFFLTNERAIALREYMKDIKVPDRPGASYFGLEYENNCLAECLILKYSHVDHVRGLACKYQ